MGRRRVTHACRCGAVAALAALLWLGTPAARAQESPNCGTIRFGTVGWLDAGASSAIATALLRGLGYDSTIQPLSVPTILASLKNGDLDVFMEIMVPTMGDALKPYVIDNSVELLRRNLSGTKYTLAVNRHGEALGISRFDEVARHADALSRKIHGVEPGADGNALIAQMIQSGRFGLGDFALVESSEADLVRAIAEANRTGAPMVFLAFEPHPMNVRFDITYLSGGDDVFGPSFGGADVYTGIRTALASECPNVAMMLGNLGFTLPMVNEIMTAILELNARPLVAAIAWMRQQPLVLRAWLEGVTTRTGEPGLPAVQAFMGIE